MKKVMLILTGFILVFLCACSYEEEYTPVRIPLCRIRAHDYFTNDPKTFVEKPMEGYEYYGMINHIDKNPENDLSTNYNEYMNKEIYISKSADTYIYIKYEKNKFLKLYHDTAARDK